MKRHIILILLFLTNCFVLISQEVSSTDDNSDSQPQKKGFHVGLYVGSYFVNKYTANMYDGYGYDFDGNKNSFENSFMYQKIVIEYGGYGYPGQPDRIAEALGVDRQTWTFDESDMPVNMKYSPAFLLGLQTRYSVDKKNAILLNINASKLTISGNFTIVTTAPTNTPINSAQYEPIKTFAIKGYEQRLQFQLGYNRILGNNEKINFIVEGGLHGTLAKFDKNIIMINNLKIDLTENYYDPNNTNPRVIKKPIGFGLGVFAGLGFNVDINPKCTIQLIYNPTFEKINMGTNPRLKMQNSIGLRAYYNL